MRATIFTKRFCAICALCILVVAASALAREGRKGDRQGKDRHPPLSALQEELGLSDSQVEQIEAIESAAATQRESLREQIRSTIESLHASNPDLTRKELRDDPSVSALKRQAQTVKQQVREDVHQVLTEDQLDQLKELRKQRRMRRCQESGSDCSERQGRRNFRRGRPDNSAGNEI